MPSLQPWQLLSYGFLHGSSLHLFANMLALYMFGPDVERLLGSRHFLIYYLACVVGAAVAQTLVTTFIYPSPYPTVGASGGIFGLLLVFGMAYPRRQRDAAVSADTDAGLAVRDAVRAHGAVSGRLQHSTGRGAFRAPRRHGGRLPADPPLARAGRGQLQLTFMPGCAPLSAPAGRRRPSSLPAHSTMPSDTPKRILRGSRLAIISTSRPTSSSGS